MPTIGFGKTSFICVTIFLEEEGTFWESIDDKEHHDIFQRRPGSTVSTCLEFVAESFFAIIKCSSIPQLAV